MNRGNEPMSTSGATVLTGANTVGLLALLAYTVRNLSEMNVYLDELKDEIKHLKVSYADNTKRTHSAIGRLNEKVSGGQSSRRRTPTPKVVEIDDNVEERVDDITAAIDELLKR